MKKMDETSGQAVYEKPAMKSLSIDSEGLLLSASGDDSGEMEISGYSNDF